MEIIISDLSRANAVISSMCARIREIEEQKGKGKIPPQLLTTQENYIDIISRMTGAGVGQIRKNLGLEK